MRVNAHTHGVLKVEHVGHERVHTVPAHAWKASLAHVHHIAVGLRRVLLGCG